MKNTKMNPINLNGETNNFLSFIEKENVNTYINEIRKFKPLTREEELNLVEEIRKGSEDAFKKFVEHNLLLVLKVAKKFMHLGIPLEDLIQSGNIGLIDAVRKYSFEIGLKEGQGNYKRNKFTSYGIWYIRKEIVYLVEECGSLIRRPHMVNNTSVKINKALDKLSYEPTVEELSKLIGESVSDVKAAISTTTSTVSTNTTLDEDNSEHSDTLGDLLEGGMYADDIVCKEDTKTEIEILLSALDDKEKLVVKMSYGIGYDYERDVNSIGAELGITSNTVRNIMNKAVRKMHKIAESIN